MRERTFCFAGMLLLITSILAWFQAGDVFAKQDGCCKNQSIGFTAMGQDYLSECFLCDPCECDGKPAAEAKLCCSMRIKVTTAGSSYSYQKWSLIPKDENEECNISAYEVGCGGCIWSDHLSDMGINWDEEPPEIQVVPCVGDCTCTNLDYADYLEYCKHHILQDPDNKYYEIDDEPPYVKVAKICCDCGDED